MSCTFLYSYTVLFQTSEIQDDECSQDEAELQPEMSILDASTCESDGPSTSSIGSQFPFNDTCDVGVLLQNGINLHALVKSGFFL